MFECRVYSCTENCRKLKVWRTKVFNTFSAAQAWVNKLAAIDLDEYENDEFAETGEYNFVDLYYEIIAI